MKFRSTFFSAFISLVLILVMTCPTAFATIQTESVKITEIRQAKSKWCWAACAEITGVATYPSSSRNQYDVVKYLKGTDDEDYPNVSGSIEDSASGTQYVAYNKVKFNSTSSRWNFSQIASSLSKGYPVQAGAGYYSNGKRDGGHVVVIFMTQFIDNASESSYYISYYDPWDGSTHNCSLDAFSNGSYNSRKYDQTIYAVW